MLFIFLTVKSEKKDIDVLLIIRTSLVKCRLSDNVASTIWSALINFVQLGFRVTSEKLKMSAGEEFEVYKGIHGQAKQSTSQLRELEKHEVLIRITHAGLCFTDVHYLEGNGDDGIVLGHEPVGVIEKIGSEVKHRKAGDRVGYGYNHGCCEVCTSCRLGHDTLCAERKMYGETDFHQGMLKVCSSRKRY